LNEREKRIPRECTEGSKRQKKRKGCAPGFSGFEFPILDLAPHHCHVPEQLHAVHPASGKAGANAGGFWTYCNEHEAGQDATPEIGDDPLGAHQFRFGYRNVAVCDEVEDFRVVSHLLPTDRE
jgi:hypothetical protein